MVGLQTDVGGGIKVSSGAWRELELTSRHWRGRRIPRSDTSSASV